MSIQFPMGSPFLSAATYEKIAGVLLTFLIRCTGNSKSRTFSNVL